MARGTVAIYDRPHPLRTRRVLIPGAIFVATGVACALYFLLG